MSQSDIIAKRYGLIPIHASQDNMFDYLSEHRQVNYVSYNRHVERGLDKTNASSISTSAICSYMSPYTPNRRLALIHSTGTGKTRKSLLAAIQYNRDITIVAVHNIQLVPFLSEFSS